MTLSAVIIAVIAVFHVVTGKDAMQSSAPSVETRIIGGIPIQISQAPYVAILELDAGEYVCTASLLSKNWAISAAHCTKRPFPFYLRVGSNTVGTGGSLHEVKQFVFYDKNDAFTNNHDIVLVEVKEPFVFSKTVSTVQIKSTSLQGGTEVIVSGFGLTEKLERTDKLRQGRTKIIDRQTCERRYLLNDWDLCIGVQGGGKGTCMGDSGGPAVVESGSDLILVGIIYIGSTEICENTIEKPTFLANVQYFFNWIKNVTQIQ